MAFSPRSIHPLDGPIRAVEDDQYGLRQDVLHLALTLASAGEHGNVCALLGQWGSGKTSIVNMMRDLTGDLVQSDAVSVEKILQTRLGKKGQQRLPKNFLEQAAQRLKASKMVFGDFNPWDQATEHHFGIALMEMAYAHLFEKRGVAYTQLKKVWRGMCRSPANAVHLGIGVLNIGWAAASALVTGIGGAGNIEMPVEIGSRNLAVEMEKLEAALRAIPRHELIPLVIVVDDIDRMPPGRIHELLLALRWMEALRDYKVSFLLLFDPEQVIDGLARAHFFADNMVLARRYAAAFMEKIIHYSIHLPVPKPAALLERFDALVRIGEHNPPLPEFASPMAGIEAQTSGTFENMDRWEAIRRFILARYLRTPRAVNRLATSVRFAWLTKCFYRGIDVRDLVAIEALQLFDRPLLEVLRNLAEVLPADMNWDELPGNMSPSEKKILRLLLSTEKSGPYRPAESGLSNPNVRDLYLLGMAPSDPMAALSMQHVKTNNEKGQVADLLYVVKLEEGALNTYVEMLHSFTSDVTALDAFLRKALVTAIDRAAERTEKEALQNLLDDL